MERKANSFLHICKKGSVYFSLFLFLSLFLLISIYSSVFAVEQVTLNEKEKLEEKGKQLYISNAIFHTPATLSSSKSQYQPYIEFGGIKYFNQESKGARVYDLFLPLFSSSFNSSPTSNTQLIFTDFRIFDRSGSSFEGNAHLGYRIFFPEKKKLFGVYTSFDRRRSSKKNYFNQITIGGECWQEKWFVGGNLYVPIGKKKRVVITETPGESVQRRWTESRSIDKVIEYTETSLNIKKKRILEKSLFGLDAEIGHSFTEQLTGYVGGYWFQDSFFKSALDREAQTKWGPKIRLTYDYLFKKTNRMLGIIDGITMEIGVQHDKPRGTSGYIGFKMNVGLTYFHATGNLIGFERHMVDFVRRDPDVVLHEEKTTTENQTFKFVREHERYKTSKELIKEFGLDSDATEQEIRKQHRNYAKKYHPDKNRDKQATEKFIYYNALYDLLKEKNREEKKDKRLSSSFPRGDNLFYGDPSDQCVDERFTPYSDPFINEVEKIEKSSASVSLVATKPLSSTSVSKSSVSDDNQVKPKGTSHINSDPIKREMSSSLKKYSKKQFKLPSQDNVLNDISQPNMLPTPEKEFGANDLINMIIQNNATGVEKLLEKGINPNTIITIQGREFKPLDIAAQHAFPIQDYAIVDLLVEHHAHCTGVAQLCLYCKMRGFYHKYEADFAFKRKFKSAFNRIKGFCAGFSRLSLSLKRQELLLAEKGYNVRLFHSMISTLADWSPNENEEYKIKNIKTLIHLVTLFQSPFDYHNIVVTSANFKDSFNLTKFREEKFDFDRQYSIVLTDINQFSDLLMYRSFQGKHIILEFLSSNNIPPVGHEVYLYVNTPSNLYYYDSNNVEGAQYYDSIAELSKEIQRYLFKKEVYDTMIVSAYDFIPKSNGVLQTDYPDQASFFPESSSDLSTSTALFALEWSIYSSSFPSVEYYFNFSEKERAVCPDPNILVFMASSVGDLVGLNFLLLKAGIDLDQPNIKYHSMTSLMLASFYNHVDTVSKLIVHGADVNYLTASGETALTQAIIGKGKATIKILFEAMEKEQEEVIREHLIAICNLIKFKKHFDVLSDVIENTYERIMALLGKAGEVTPNYLLLEE